MARPPVSHKPPPKGRPELRSRPDSPPPARPEPKTDKVAGLPAVAALFARDPKRVESLVFEARWKEAAQPFCKDLSARHKSFRQVGPEELTRIAGSPMHGGIVALARPKPVLLFDPLDAKGWAEARQPLLLLDGIGNPHNLGAIARTMAFFGLEHLVISDHPGQAGPSESAMRVAEGGLEWISLHRTAKFLPALKRLRDSYRVIGTALGSGRPLAEVLGRPGKPVALILGNEEHGLSPDTLAACDDIATIPGSGRVQSLNVAATAAILIHALAAKR